MNVLCLMSNPLHNCLHDKINIGESKINLKNIHSLRHIKFHFRETCQFFLDLTPTTFSYNTLISFECLDIKKYLLKSFIDQV